MGSKTFVYLVVGSNCSKKKRNKPQLNIFNGNNYSK